MKKTILAIAAIATLCACGKNENNRNAELAIQKGREAAQEVISTPANSMQREKALLSIKAMHERILAAGDTAAAQLYLLSAEEVLDSAKIINKVWH